MACISIYLFILCIVQFTENRQIKIQGLAAGLDSFLAIIVGIKRPFHLTDITTKSLIWMEALLHQKNYLQRKILWNTIIKYYVVTWLIFMNQVTSCPFGINEYLQSFHKYLPTKHLNVYSILVQRVVNFTTNWVSDIASIKCLKATILLR